VPDSERRLWLLRHAKTVVDPPPGGKDFDRVLSPRGRRDARALARRLGDGGDRLGMDETTLPQVVLCSSARRTMQTAELVVAEMTKLPEVLARRSLYGASPETVLAELRALDDEYGAAMVVGHNPTAHRLAYELIDAEDEDTRAAVSRGFPTCALAVYRFGVGRWADVADGTGQPVGIFSPPY
jgi:phosphohistidine phosphatase